MYNNYQSAYFNTSQQPVATQLLAADILEAYNIMLQVGVEYGLIGLFLFVWILYEAVHLCKSFYRVHAFTRQSAGSTGCLLSVFIASLFSNPFHVTPVLLLVLYHISNVMPPKPPPTGRRPTQFYFPLFVIPVCITLAYYLIQKYKAEKTWAAAATAATMNDYASAQRLYKLAYPMLAHNGDFLFNYGAEAGVAGDYASAITQLQLARQYSSLSSVRLFLADAYVATQQYPLAEENYLAAIFTVPGHIYPKYKLVQLYKHWGKTLLARQWATQTLHYPVKVPSALSAGLLQSLQKDIEINR